MKLELNIHGNSRPDAITRDCDFACLIPPDYFYKKDLKDKDRFDPVSTGNATTVHGDKLWLSEGTMRWETDKGREIVVFKVGKKVVGEREIRPPEELRLYVKEGSQIRQADVKVKP